MTGHFLLTPVPKHFGVQAPKDDKSAQGSDIISQS